MMIRSCVTQLAPLARAKELSVDTELPFEPLCVPADADKICRTLTNILANAVKFTPRGGKITAGVRAESSASEAVFWVSDTGEGIPENDREHIFEKFGQVENRKAGRKMSTGLGLTFCKMTVEAHGGRIWVVSEAGQGSTFSFALPLKTIT
jgi:signal transduction histidine kinase